MTGLINRKTKKTLPLRSSSIRAEIKGFTARTTAVLTYYNDNRTEIEGLFLLPLDHTATIVEFEAIIENHYIFADVRDSSDTHEMEILHRTKNLQDGYFNVSVGKISPWVIAEIQVTIVCEISALIFGDALRYTLPQAFSPKVITSEEAESKMTSRTISTSTLGYCFNIEIEIEAPCLLYGVQSNTHPIQVDAPPLSKTGSKIVVSIPHDFEPHDEVFELLMFLCRPREPYIVIEEAKITASDTIDDEDRNPINSIMNNPILMLSYSPDIPPLTNDPCITAHQTGEFILIIDSSISLDVNRVKESCVIFLKSLPCNCFFNVVSFAAEFKTLFQTSQSYTCATLESAVSFVLELVFSLKSGPLFQPLKWLFDQDELAHKPKQIFIVTADKENEELSPVSWYRSRSKDALARCFVFYVGETRCQHHLEMLATITRGKYIMALEERLQRLMVTCLLAAVQPVITDVNVSWILPDAYDVIYTPEKLPSVFLGERLNLYAILASKELCPGDKPSESGNSVKEFWFEDTDFFQDDFENKSSYLPLPNRERSPYSPSKHQETTKEDSVDHDNEVFLTEEEVRQLSHELAYPKRSSIDRVKKWKVSKFPQNQDIGSDFEDDQQQPNKMLQEKDNLYTLNQHHNTHSTIRKKSSTDGAESVGSSNSYGSNRSSSSHFYAFPGYPTRMSSCRSIEARSPHVPKYPSDDIFSFQDNSKLHSSKMSSSQVNLSDYSSDHHSSGHHSSVGMHKEPSHPRPMARLTEALYAEKANTHLIDQSNEPTIELLLENLVMEKRKKLLLWLREQEEMTQCLWPMTEYEKRECMEKHEWRDSGIGNRSSSDAHTSDLEEEATMNRKRFFGSEEIILHATATSTNEKSKEEVLNVKEKESISRTDSSSNRHSENVQKAPTKTRISNRTSNSSNNSQFQKRKSKARSMWNAIIDKVRSVGAMVSEKSGETTFKRNPYDSPSDFERKHYPFTAKNAHITNNFRPLRTAASKDAIYDSADNFFTNKEHSSFIASASTERKSEPPSVRPRSQGGHNNQLKNRPIIENSRTISTTSMFEIGKSEIGDVENLHLLPSHALIYLSGQCGEHVFKRLIPFQLEVDGAQTSGLSTCDTTVHQLAAKSIIHDLELQMEHDGMLEDHGKVYIKNLIGEVSKAANVLSKYTTLVAIDDKCNQNEVLSTMEYEDTDISSSKFQTAHSDTTTTQLTTRNMQENGRASPLEPFTYYVRLLCLMVSDGSWRLTDELAELLSVTIQNIHESSPFNNFMCGSLADDYERSSGAATTQDGLYQSIWATALALTWLRSTCHGYKEEWQLAETKSKYWLLQQSLPAGFALTDLYVIAESTLKTLNTWLPNNTIYWNKKRK